jgi:hypothetical protein
MRTKRVGWRLLALLWVWAALMFLVVDLFLDAPGLDRVRPRAPIYRAMRMTAHEMVGETYREEQPATLPKRGGVGAPARAGPDPAIVLERLRHERAAPWASTLLDLRDHVPPELAGAYGEAAAAAAAELAAPDGAASDEARALASAALEAQAQGLLLPMPDWHSARVTVERIAWAFPEWERTFEAEISGIRCALGRELGAPRSEDALAEAVQLAAVAGDECLAGACLRLLPREPTRPRTREDALVQEHAARAVARWGTEQDRVALDVWLGQALAREDDGAHRRALLRNLEDLRSGRDRRP